MLRAAYLLLIVVCILPIVPGAIGVVLSSLGYLPPIGLTTVSFDGFAAVLSWSAVWKSISLTLSSTILSSVISCFLAFSIIQGAWHSKFWRIIEKSLAPLLAMPHVAFAIGFAFLFSPTGLFSRLFDTLFELDSISFLVKDSFGIGLSLALALKEVPFLLLMSIPILKQLKIDQLAKVTTSLGYAPAQFWWKCIFPQWLVKIRFPLIAIIAYSASVVDLSLILGPTNPPTFAVLVWQWFSEPDLSLFPRAGAGAVILFCLCCLLIALLRFIEWFVIQHKREWQYSGRSGKMLSGKNSFSLLLLINILIVPITLLWSFAGRWRFPDIVPSQFTTRFWTTEWASIWPTISDSFLLAFVSATLALFFALIAQEYQKKHHVHIPKLFIAIPILVPQLSLLFGIQVATLYVDSNNYLLWVIWSHIFFAFPYVFLALDGPWQSYDDGYSKTALSLGKSPFYVWLKIKATILFPAIMFAWATGASVSLAQYLPTLMLGAGRISTITTEAVALSSGFDRRVTSIYALWQALLPLLFFSIAFLLSRVKNLSFSNHNRKPITSGSYSKKPRHL